MAFTAVLRTCVEHQRYACVQVENLLTNSTASDLSGVQFGISSIHGWADELSSLAQAVANGSAGAQNTLNLAAGQVTNGIASLEAGLGECAVAA